MSRKLLWALTVEAPLSATDMLMAHLPDKAVGESAFIKDANDRRQDPTWVVQALYKEEPELAGFETMAAITAAACGASAFPVSLSRVPAEGWLAANQASYPPISAGRFVIHSARSRGKIPRHLRGIEMEVSCAFGTGEHPTTFGCLMALQTLKGLGPRARMLDVGTGTGVLAIAAARLFGLGGIGGDMDAPSVAVAAENVKKNGLAGRVRMVTALGTRSQLIRRSGPYDLILSNIFARPLARLAPALAASLKPGGHLILAGFLHKDCNWVRLAYAGQGIFLKTRLRFGHWSILILKKR